MSSGVSPHESSGLHARVSARRGEFVLDVDLSVAPGEVLALVGANGSGKSTTLHALTGLVPAPGSRIVLGGRLLDGAGTHVPPAERRIGTVFQDHLLVPHLSAIENVAFGLRARGERAARARAVAADWLDRVGLADHAGRRASRLSGGQQQRVALARALAAGPDLLLLDEPFAALDVETRDRVHQLLRAHLSELRIPVLLVSHHAADVEALADRVLRLDHGRMVPDQSGVVASAALPAPRTAPQVGVLVLAGGTARRLGGGDKTSLPVGGTAILDRLLTAVAPLPTVVLADDPGTSRFDHVRWLREDPPGAGPAAALAAGLAAWAPSAETDSTDTRASDIPSASPVPNASAAPNTPAVPRSPTVPVTPVEVVVVLAGDQPFAGEAVPRLLTALAENPAMAAAVALDPDGRPQHLLAAYRTPALRAALAGVRPGDSLRAVRGITPAVLVAATAAETLDVDTPEDLQAARQAADVAHPGAAPRSAAD